MRKLALLVPGLHQGGGVPAVARFVLEAAIRHGGWEVKPISLCMAPDDPESSSFLHPSRLFRSPSAGVRLWMDQQVPHLGARFGEFEFQRYRPRKVLVDMISDCDVIQVVCGSPAWANAVVGLGKPVSLQVATLAKVERRIRDGTQRGLKAGWRRFMTRITDRLDDRALRMVDAIQLENPWMLEHVRHVNLGRLDVDIRYAPPGVDTAVFTPTAERNPESGAILCVGRLDDPRKNIHLLLEAYAILPSDMRNLHRLILAGTGGPGESFWCRASALGLREHIEFIHSPDQTALVSLYQQAAVFALPSDEEGLGVVVLEAMACGVPVVSTLCGGPDGIISEGVDGYLVPRDDASAMAAALIKALDCSTKNFAMGVAARSTIEQRYALDIAGQEFLHVWDCLAEGCVPCAV